LKYLAKDPATALLHIKDEKFLHLPASPLEKTQGALNALNQKFGNSWKISDEGCTIRF